MAKRWSEFLNIFNITRQLNPYIFIENPKINIFRGFMIYNSMAYRRVVIKQVITYQQCSRAITEWLAGGASLSDSACPSPGSMTQGTSDIPGDKTENLVLWSWRYSWK